MKVVAFNGSPKPNGNTFHAISMVAKELEEQGIEVEIIHVGNKEIRGCIACNQCARNKNEQCGIQDEYVNGWIQKMKEADGIIVGTPVHFASMSATLKSFLDRAFYVSSMNGGMFRHKVGATIVSVRRSGGVTTFDQLNNYFIYSEMLLATSNYWNVIHGNRQGEVLQDDEGVQIMSQLGKNMAWFLNMVQSNKTTAPTAATKIYTNFIR